MANGLSHFAVNKIGDVAFRKEAFTFPTTWYIALGVGGGTASAPGTEVSTSGTGYARAALTASLAAILGTNGTTAVSTGALREFVNAALLSYGAGNTTGSWGTPDHFYLMDALTGGNYWGTAPLSPAIAIASGVPKPEFAAGVFKIQFAAIA